MPEIHKGRIAEYCIIADEDVTNMPADPMNKKQAILRVHTCTHTRVSRTSSDTGEGGGLPPYRMCLVIKRAMYAGPLASFEEPLSRSLANFGPAAPNETTRTSTTSSVSKNALENIDVDINNCDTQTTIIKR